MSEPTKTYSDAEFSKGYQPQMYARDPRSVRRYDGLQGVHLLRPGVSLDKAPPQHPEAGQSNDFWEWHSTPPSQLTGIPK
jgi:hypothetical protein